jgi:stringent starvation protein B
MTSNKPYIVRAFYQWISDNQLTPYVVVDVNVYGVLVPMGYVNDGQIVLNISGGAVGSIALDDDTIELSARFGGKLEHITIPYGAVAAIYAKENGAGTSLAIEHPEHDEEAYSGNNESAIGLTSVKTDTSESKVSKESKSTSKGKPSLKVIK